MERKELRLVIDDLVNMVKHKLPSGDRSRLKHLNLNDFYSPAFWKMVCYLRSVGWLPNNYEEEEKWAVTFSCVALLADLHRKSIHLGTALITAEMNEMRFRFLLSSRGNMLLALIYSTARYLAVKEKNVDIYGLIKLLFSEKWSSFEKVREQIARNYYLNGSFE
ncbi:MAG: type I-E CRISPR-associated protein Cse2/CasB [Candidatus Hodarchaeales archaeon]|jgi:hypothetical protein